MKNINEADIKNGAKVFVRCDIDVPVTNGKITEQYRLDAGLETLRYIIGKNALPIIAGHMGKPEKFDPKFSTQQLQDYYENHLGKDNFVLLENLKFDPREVKPDEIDKNDEFAKGLSQIASFYVNDSFASCHREYSSIVKLPKLLPAYAGFRLIKEIQNLSKFTGNPPRPLTAIIGGAKLESKKPLVNKFLSIADYVLVGGRIGLDWQDKVPDNLHLPLDYADKNMDIGTNTISKFSKIITGSKSVLWAGPLGAYEQKEYSEGTNMIAQALAFATQKGTYSLIGGGDTIAAVNQLGLLDKFSFVSTGGGAMLNFIAYGTLPGIEALNW